jgi:hypothetical protein
MHTDKKGLVVGPFQKSPLPKVFNLCESVSIRGQFFLGKPYWL